MQPPSLHPSQYSDQQLLEELLALEPENAIAHEIRRQLITQEKLTPEQRAIILILRDSASKRKAAEVLNDEDIRAYLCAALLRGSDDIFEMSKIITPILLGLAAAGTTSIPLIPVLFASIALHIARMSIATLCADYEKQK